jgi:DNA helicase-2/ATP-dependent DNA helicase PcrA
MAGRADEIVILICNRKVQLNTLEQALTKLDLPYDLPRGDSFIDKHESVRAVYSALRILRDIKSKEEDYPAYRDLLELLSGVGPTTAKELGDKCIQNNQNFRELFHLPVPPAWLNKRAASACQRVCEIVQAVSSFDLTDTVAARRDSMTALLRSNVLTSGKDVNSKISIWTGMADALPQEMTLQELLYLLEAETEAEQQAVFDAVNNRLGTSGNQAKDSQSQTVMPKKIRILTMHGAKGLSGSVVFIPSVEQGIIPSMKALKATGLLIEQRRLFYVSVTRARACCIISHVKQRIGATAQTLAQQPLVSLARSQFVSEMGLPSITRNSGLSATESAAIVNEVNNL